MTVDKTVIKDHILLDNSQNRIGIFVKTRLNANRTTYIGL